MRVQLYNGLLSAFTLVELMISMAVFMLVLASLISSHLFGLKVFQLTQSKIAATDEATRAMSLLVTDLQRATDFQIGQGASNYFSPKALGTVQQGNSLQLYFNTNTNQFVRYFGGAQLRRMTNGRSVTLASSLITNAFSAENFTGSLLTNLPASVVVKVELGFSYRLGFYDSSANTNLRENYQFQTRIARKGEY